MCNLRNIPPLEQVCRLEQLLSRDAIAAGSSQEGLDVLHQHEGGALGSTKYIRVNLQCKVHDGKACFSGYYLRLF